LQDARQGDITKAASGLDFMAKMETFTMHPLISAADAAWHVVV
jgi:hypothetical protein